MIKAILKSQVLPQGRKPRTVPAGLLRGIKLNIDFSSQTQLFLGLSEYETHKFMRHLCRDIRTAVDIGAGSGEQTLFFLVKTKAEKIYAFEPEPGERKSLNDNLCLNVIDRSRLVLSDKFVGAKADGCYISLDEALKDISFPCFIKMDIEGAETFALQGASELISKKKVRWLIETHSAENEEQCIRILSDHGFQYEIIRRAWWRLFIPETRPGAHNRWLVAFNG